MIAAPAILLIAALFAPVAATAQQAYLLHGRVQIDFNSSPSYAGSGCNGGPYTALFNIMPSNDPGSGSEATWAQFATDAEKGVASGDPYDNDAGAPTGTAQLSGGCTGSYSLDSNASDWYVEYDANGTWHFSFGYGLAGTDFSNYISFDATTVTTDAVSGSTTAAYLKNEPTETGGTICLSPTP